MVIFHSYVSLPEGTGIDGKIIYKSGDFVVGSPQHHRRSTGELHHREDARCRSSEVLQAFALVKFLKINREMIWVSYNELTTSSLEIIVSKGNHPQMALIQVSEL